MSSPLRACRTILCLLPLLYASGSSAAPREGVVVPGSPPSRLDARAGDAKPPAATTDDGFVDALAAIAHREYWASDGGSGLQAPNREHDFRARFDGHGIRIENRDASRPTTLLGLTLTRVGYRSSPLEVPPGEVAHTRGRVELTREPLGLVEWFENSEAGLEQGFTLSRPPTRTTGEELLLELRVSGARVRAVGDGVRIESDSGRMLDYSKLEVHDAERTALPARFEIAGGDRIRIVVEDTAAVYPIVIDPLVTAVPDAVVEANQVGARLGSSVATAGDVNRDGFDDVIIGAPSFDNGQADEGAAFLFLGSPSGIGNGNPGLSDATFESNQASAAFGTSVASAGDVNGDGYADVLIGAPLYDAGENDEGAAFLFLGSAAGIASGSPATAHARLESNQCLNSCDGVFLPGAQMGTSVSSAGDVNGDGYSDVIVGAPRYTAGHDWEGAAFLYFGSASGIANGNPTTADGRFESNQAASCVGFFSNEVCPDFGWSVASAGDVNGDGFADVLVGARGYNNGEVDEGAAFLWLGSIGGIVNGTPANANAIFESNQGPSFAFDSGALLGATVSGAGDVNGDGYADILIGAPGWDGGQLTEGAALLFHGSATGSPGGNPATANARLEIDLTGVQFGFAARTAGDVNGDGYADIVVGAPNYDSPTLTDVGRAFVFLGTAQGIRMGVGATPVLPLAGPLVAAGNFGSSASSMGDVDGDGYDDVVVGAYRANLGQAEEGVAHAFRGNRSGVLQETETTADAVLQKVPGPGSTRPLEVAGAGDVNGDGYDDVLIADPGYDGGSQDEGAVFVLLGSAAGIQSGSIASAQAVIQADQINAGMGSCVRSAGDVNGDGYADILIGAALYDDPEIDEGAAFVFLGSSTGISSGNPASAHARFESNQAGARAGIGCDSAGDVNADGYGDVLVGADRYSAPESLEGAAWLYLGSPTGIASGNPGTAHARFESNQANAQLGFQVASAGDVNGDGFGDIIVSSLFDPAPQTDQGGALLFHGSAAGIPNGSPTAANTHLQPNDFGGSFALVASAGDVNTDGYGDVVVAVQGGSTYVFHGAAAGIPNGDPSNAATALTATSALVVGSAGDIDGNGHDDVLVGSFGLGVDVYEASASGIPSSSAPAPRRIAQGSDPEMGVGAAFAGDVDGDGQGDLILCATNNAYLFRGSSPPGRLLLARQRRGDGSGIVVPPGGVLPTGQFLAELFVRSPRGHEYGKLEVETCAAGVAIGAPACARTITSSWVDLGTTGALLSQSILGLESGNAYVWRARARFAPYQPTLPGAAVDEAVGPWFRVGARPWATDVRVPEPTLGMGLLAGGLLLARFARRRRDRCRTSR